HNAAHHPGEQHRPRRAGLPGDRGRNAKDAAPDHDPDGDSEGGPDAQPARELALRDHGRGGAGTDIRQYAHADPGGKGSSSNGVGRVTSGSSPSIKSAAVTRYRPGAAERPAARPSQDASKTRLSAGSS